MMCFTGEVDHQLDDKNRIRIPAKMRSGLGSSYYFARGMDHCIFVLPEETFEKMAQDAMEGSPFDPNVTSASRNFFRSVFPAEEDTQGRAVLPQKLREYANITKEVVIFGAGKRIEIWSKENFELADLDNSYDEDIKKINKND